MDTGVIRADAPAAAAVTIPPQGSWREVLAVFLRLGLTSFGGPVAHLGYFRDEFVVRRRWLDDRAYADLVALCQFLRGPASSQVGIAIGLSRAGFAGAVAAWIGFTLPSALALVLFAYGVGALGDVSGAGWLHGLKVVAVAVVAQAVLGMMRTLAPDRERATMAVIAAIVALAIPTAWGQVGAILLGGVAGVILLREEAPTDHAALPLKVSRAMRHSRRFAASTPRWLACYLLRSINRSGFRESLMLAILASHARHFCCCLCGKCRRGWWLPSARSAAAFSASCEASLRCASCGRLSGLALPSFSSSAPERPQRLGTPERLLRVDGVDKSATRGSLGGLAPVGALGSLPADA
jgi:chromate transport protein ChrA